MDRNKLRKLRRELDKLRGQAGGLRGEEIAAFAAKLGRVRAPRGKEPTYVSTLLPKSFPISIPQHSRPLNKYTALKILGQLEGDLDALEAQLEQEEDEP